MTQESFYNKYLSLPGRLQGWLILSCCFSCLLLCARVIATGYVTYIFLVWNLFLAFIPYAISNWLYDNRGAMKGRLKQASVIAAWLLFIPNSFYILTDLFHLDEINSAPKWFDLLMLLSFAWNGLLLGIISLRKMETILYRASGNSFSLLMIFTVMWLNAYGIYIGRFLRYNSWDIITQPFSLAGEMFEMLFHPFQNKMEWGMIFCYAIFMTLLYVTVKKMAENFNQLSKSINQNK
jgi:uncharacterized membrane protein